MIKTRKLYSSVIKLYYATEEYNYVIWGLKYCAIEEYNFITEEYNYVIWGLKYYAIEEYNYVTWGLW